ncbi:hypothetical protein ACFPN1_13975 [Lysobacter yangpyeongensis]|jgi:hypothetical protein|uniref:DUF378 domain-containing protein n=1 Tax=Lysobacter yangpyeongensis TaxID=346182 RepID=A0ABW0SQL2_9GAMM
MKSWGMWFVILGLGSFLLNLVGIEFVVLGWIDNWGPTVGIGIRVGLIVIGAAMWLIGRKQEAGQPAA